MSSNVRTDERASHTGSILRTLAPDIVGPAAVISASVLAMLMIGGARPTVRLAGGAFIGAAVAFAGGLGLLRLCRVQLRQGRLAVALIVGLVPPSFAIVLATLAFGLTAGSAFMVWAVLAVALYGTAAPEADVTGRNADAWQECGVIALLAVIVVLWCRVEIAAWPVLSVTHQLNVWTDFYVHGAQLVGLSGAWQPQGAMILANSPPFPYHYAFYAPSALVHSIANLPGLAVATGFMLPSSLLVTALGIYALGAVLSSRTVGLLCSLAFFMLPDAGSYGLANGLLSAHFYLCVSPGTGYGLGLSATAIALAARSRQVDGRGCLLASLATAAAVSGFSAMLGLLLLPALVATLGYDRVRSPRVVKIIHGATLVVTAFVPLAIMVIEPLRMRWLTLSAGHQFFESMHTGMSPTGYDGLHTWLLRRFGPAWTDVAGFVLVPAAVLGVLLPVFPVAMMASRSRPGRHVLDAFPAVLVLGYLALVLFAPVSRIGWADYQLRQFVLVYAVVLTWTILFVARWLGAEQSETLPWVRGVSVIVTAASLAVLLWRAPEPARPRFGWGAQHAQSRLRPGILEAASFIRAQGHSNDVIAVLPVQVDAFVIDASTEIASLADRPLYLARPAVYKLQGPAMARLIEKRVAVLRGLGMTAEYQSALAGLRHEGIRWLISLERPPAFDPEGSRAVFGRVDAFVYAVEPVTSDKR